MTKELILQRLQLTIDKLKQLSPAQFNYESYVTEFNNKGCGTVCCVAGWYPEWFREAGLKWNELHGLISDESHPLYTLAAYHGVNDEIIDCLFYGLSVRTKDNMRIIEPDGGITSDLSMVIEAWEQVYKAIENKEINYLP